MNYNLVREANGDVHINCNKLLINYRQFEDIVNEIVNKRVEVLENRIKELELEVKYRPDGTGYQEIRREFEN